MDYDTHSQGLLGGNGSYAPPTVSTVPDGREISEPAPVSGMGQGSGEEHIRFGGSKEEAVLQSARSGEGLGESEDVFDEFGNPIETESISGAGGVPMV